MCLAAAIFLDDIDAFTDGFTATSPRKTSVQDRNGVLTKGYISKMGGTAAGVAAGTIWDDTMHYRFAWMQDVATRFSSL